MAERKVFQKYYPADFDPAKIPTSKTRKNGQFDQRVMVAYNMQCNTCTEFIYKGTKLNMQRETAEGETYLGLKIFRFYFNCPNCKALITFKTNLENCDYKQEHGATRLYEAKQQKKEEETKDQMEVFEKRMQASLTKMEALEELEDLREVSRRNESVDVLGILGREETKKQLLEEQKDEELIKAIMSKKRARVVVEEEIRIKGIPKKVSPAESAQKMFMKGVIVRKRKLGGEEASNMN